MIEVLERRTVGHSTLHASGPVHAPELVEPSRLHTEEMVLNIGPQHPSTHGVLRLETILDGEVVVDVIPHIGYLHRCFEKHAENMTYPQVIPYVDRLDYIAAMCSEHSYVTAVERMMNIELPDKVEYIRVLFAELQRIASHLIAIGTFGLDTGAFTPFLYCFRDRETILEMFEKTCGARFLYNYMWVGGLSHDLHPDVLPMCREFVAQSWKTHKEINDLLTLNRIFLDRTAGIGVLDPQVAVNGGASGPMLRATGIKWDIRRNDPYSIYDRFDFEIAVGRSDIATLGDSFNRHWVRMREWEESLKIIEQILEQYPQNDATDVQSAIPKRLKPEGAIFSRTESPRGELGFYIEARGDVKPWRVKLRSPAYSNLSLLPLLSRGYLIADLIVILGSIDIVMGEIDH